MNILMIDDDQNFATNLSRYFNKYNINIKNYKNPLLGFSENISKFDVLILELKINGMDGLSMCRDISSKHNIPIIISSYEDHLYDMVLGLQMGADYYLPKPYDFSEIYAVIQSLIRRKKRLLHENYLNFILDTSKSQVIFKGKELVLTQAEYEVMQCLLKNKNAVVSREQIIYNCMCLTDNSNSKSLDVIIGRIRKKLNDTPRNPKYLYSIRGLGYKILQ